MYHAVKSGRISLGISSFCHCQRELTSLPSDSVLRIVDGADHMSLVRSDHDSEGVLSTIMDVVDAVKSNRPIRSKRADR